MVEPSIFLTPEELDLLNEILTLHKKAERKSYDCGEIERCGSSGSARATANERDLLETARNELFEQATPAVMLGFAQWQTWRLAERAEVWNQIRNLETQINAQKPDVNFGTPRSAIASRGFRLNQEHLQRELNKLLEFVRRNPIIEVEIEPAS